MKNTKKIRILLSAVLATSVVQYNSSVFAQDVPEGYGDCTCVTTADANSSAGVIEKADGEVLADGVSAKSGSALQIGSQILTGQKGSAEIVVGKTCRISLDANEQVLISKPAADICVQRYANNDPNLPGGKATSAGPLLLLLAGAGGVGAVVANSNDDDDDGGGDRPPASN